MKLKNKKTGEIRNCQIMADGFIVINSLKDLEEWEDYEEPKTCWYIDCNGDIFEKSEIANYYNPAMKEIGNYFKTKEEAERAVRKLKAWKRLREECDFRFTGWKRDEQYSGDFIITAQDWNTSDDKLLDLLFGGRNE